MPCGNSPAPVCVPEGQSKIARRFNAGSEQKLPSPEGTVEYSIPQTAFMLFCRAIPPRNSRSLAIRLSHPFAAGKRAPASAAQRSGRAAVRTCGQICLEAGARRINSIFGQLSLQEQDVVVLLHDNFPIRIIPRSFHVRTASVGHSATGADFSEALGTSWNLRGWTCRMVLASPCATSECFPAVPVPTVRMRREVMRSSDSMRQDPASALVWA